MTHPNAIASVGTISALLTGIVGCIHESDGTQADQIAREEIHAQSSSVKTGPAEPSDTSATGQADPGINHTDDSVSEITMSEILISPQELGHRFMGNSWTTCADGFRVSGMPARDVLRLSLLCGPYHGMRRTEHEWNGYVAELNPVEVDVVVESNHCVRVFAAADPTMEMKLDLLDSS
ncbi:MAG: hypothetical protein FWD57_08490, partial [Polyangiaceae bacterium]|nr:hypothetical protein [Polyangiaceae bacterium]